MVLSTAPAIGYTVSAASISFGGVGGKHGYGVAKADAERSFSPALATANRSARSTSAPTAVISVTVDHRPRDDSGYTLAARADQKGQRRQRHMVGGRSRADPPRNVARVMAGRPVDGLGSGGLSLTLSPSAKGSESTLADLTPSGVSTSIASSRLPAGHADPCIAMCDVRIRSPATRPRSGHCPILFAGR